MAARTRVFQLYVSESELCKERKKNYSIAMKNSKKKKNHRKPSPTRENGGIESLCRCNVASRYGRVRVRHITKTDRAVHVSNTFHRAKPCGREFWLLFQARLMYVLECVWSVYWIFTNRWEKTNDHQSIFPAIRKIKKHRHVSRKGFRYLRSLLRSFYSLYLCLFPVSITRTQICILFRCKHFIKFSFCMNNSKVFHSLRAIVFRSPTVFVSKIKNNICLRKVLQIKMKNNSEKRDRWFKSALVSG